MQTTTGIARARVAKLARACLCALALSALGCNTRERPASAPVYDGTVGALLADRCARCHAGGDAAAGWSVDSYLETIACTTDGVPVTVVVSEVDGGVGAGADATDGTPLLLTVLDRPDHVDMVSADERKLLEDWIAAGTPKNEGALHPVGWLDPRSPRWHGRAASADDWLLLKNPKLDDSCGRCHAGAPSREPTLSAPPDSAPDCTSCHDDPGGVLACRTCHGHDERGVPPRDACFFPDGPVAAAHVPHLDGASLAPIGIDCASCHPALDSYDVLSERHANGTLDVDFGGELAGDDAEYDPEAQRCAVGCHTRGGDRQQPRWSETGPLGCNDCHSTPPTDHYVGACNGCHPGVSADGTELVDESRHLDGEVSLGDGSGTCSGCHGSDGSPWPSDGAHPAHGDSTLSNPVACESCHLVPETVMDEGHLDRTVGAEVTFGGLALARGSEPLFDVATETCSEVACHGAKLGEPPPGWPRWQAAQPGDARCGACHGIPPGAPHPAEQGCESLICHGGEVAQWPDGPRITDSGRGPHINGAIDVGTP